MAGAAGGDGGLPASCWPGSLPGWQVSTSGPELCGGALVYASLSLPVACFVGDSALKLLGKASNL